MSLFLVRLAVAQKPQTPNVLVKPVVLALYALCLDHRRCVTALQRDPGFPGLRTRLIQTHVFKRVFPELWVTFGGEISRDLRRAEWDLEDGMNLWMGDRRL